MKLRVMIGFFVAFAIFTIVTKWSFAIQNICQLCASNLSSKQTSICNSTIPTNFQICHLCEKKGVYISDEIEGMPVTIQAHQMQADPKFMYTRKQILESELLMYNPELNIDFSIPISKTSMIPSFDIESPLVPSAIDGELIPFEGFLRLWWNAAVTATVPIPPTDYQLEIYALHDIPGPVAIRVLISGKQLGILQWDQADESWSSKCMYIPVEYFSRDFQTVVTLEYFNDDITIQGDRDAAIAWIRLVPINKP